MPKTSNSAAGGALPAAQIIDRRALLSGVASVPLAAVTASGHATPISSTHAGLQAEADMHARALFEIFGQMCSDGGTSWWMEFGGRPGGDLGWKLRVIYPLWKPNPLMRDGGYMSDRTRIVAGGGRSYEQLVERSPELLDEC
ncbi:MAG: hypothetical protein H6882_02580 [Rhodobiaceae bacterium]|nr:hypothetical protein [Rhodobiaceae bacterium]